MASTSNQAAQALMGSADCATGLIRPQVPSTASKAVAATASRGYSQRRADITAAAAAGSATRALPGPERCMLAMSATVAPPRAKASSRANVGANPKSSIIASMNKVLKSCQSATSAGANRTSTTGSTSTTAESRTVRLPQVVAVGECHRRRSVARINPVGR